MTENKDKKKKPVAHEEHATMQRAVHTRVGDRFRETREAMGLTIENVSAAINIRAVQLRAIEEGHIEALPGMIYAAGFVKNYANYLKLDAPEMVRMFKAEHGADNVPKPELHFPEPLQEDKLPTQQMMLIGGGVLAAVLILWAIFSGGGHDSEKLAKTIPEAPAPVQQVTEASANMPPVPPGAETDPAQKTQEVVLGSGDESAAEGGSAKNPPAEGVADAKGVTATKDLKPADVKSGLAASAASGTAAAPAVSDQDEDTSVAPDAVVKPDVVKPIDAEKADQKPGAISADAAPQDSAEAQKPPGAEDSGASVKVKQDQDTGVIEIKPPAGRVVLTATEVAWVQVDDASGRSIFKKVMKVGEKYTLPNKPGLTLTTSNAGGIVAFVDGSAVQALGRKGDIIRGVPLDPASLKKQRFRVRDY